MKFSFYIFISSLTLIFCITRQIQEINLDSFKSYIESNKYDENKKLLIVFYKQNSTYCEDALNLIEKNIIKDYNFESGVEFGKINVDNNLWLNLQFNIKSIPYIILIKGNYFYELNQKPDQYSIKDLINLSLNDLNKKPIPEEINTIRKILFILNFSIRFISIGFYNIFKISLSKNIIIFIFIIILCLILWIIKRIINLICSICCRIKNKYKGSKKNEEGISKLKEEIELDKYSDKLSEDKIENKSEEKDNNNSDILKQDVLKAFNEQLEESEYNQIKENGLN